MTLYPMPPGAEFGDEPVASATPLANGWRSLETAAELWELADAERATALRTELELATRAGQEDHPWLGPESVERVVGLLFGLEEALVDAGVMDPRWRIVPGQAARLAARVRAMDVRPERTDDELGDALAEVVFAVRGVRTFLAEAMVEGWSVVLD